MNTHQSTEYSAKLAHGRVEIHHVRDGSLKRTLFVPAQFAVVSGDAVHVNRTDGRLEIYCIESGALIRRF